VAKPEYEIVLEGELDERLYGEFEATTITRINGNTVLIAAVRDQTHLHELLQRVFDLGLTLVRAAPADDSKDQRPRPAQPPAGP
jgi:hypothetical protein